LNPLKSTQATSSSARPDDKAKPTAPKSESQRALDLRSKALIKTQAALEAARQENKLLNAKIEAYETQLNKAEQYRQRALTVAAELDLQRSRRILRLIGRLFDRSDVYDLIAPPYQQIKDDSVIFNHGLKNYRLQASDSLHRIPFLSYDLQFEQHILKSIIVLPILDIPVSMGYLGLELINPANEILAQPTFPAGGVSGLDMVRFDFGPGIKVEGKLELRIFSRGLDAPLRIYEWRRFTLFGLGPLRRKAFMGFEFLE
jgi:hypothetical protein